MTTWMDFQGPGFTLTVPSDWLIQASQTVQAAFLSPDRGQPFRANLVITLRPVQPDVTATVVAAAASESQLQEYPQYTIQVETSAKAGAIEGFYRRYRWFNVQENLAVLQSQSFFVHQQVLFTLTATCLTDDHSEIPSILKRMIDTFML